MKTGSLYLRCRGCRPPGGSFPPIARSSSGSAGSIWPCRCGVVSGGARPATDVSVVVVVAAAGLRIGLRRPSKRPRLLATCPTNANCSQCWPFFKRRKRKFASFSPSTDQSAKHATAVPAKKTQEKKRNAVVPVRQCLPRCARTGSVTTRYSLGR